MMHIPKKVYILENGGYIELSYGEFCRRLETDQSYAEKKFLPLHGMLMEVSKADYEDFYRQKRRQKYIKERSRNNGDVSYDRLVAEGFSGSAFLSDGSEDIADQVVRRILLEKLYKALPLLAEDEWELIYRHYYIGISEKELATAYGISQQAVSKRIVKIRDKLKKLMEN